MSGLEPLGEYDFNSLTQSSLRYFIDPDKFITFLNNTQAGSAHLAYGTDFAVLVKHLATALCACTVQILLFCYLRTLCKNIYEPRCFFTPADERMQELPSGYFDWVWVSWNYDVSFFLSMGLDTYFFLRFLNVLLIFFATCGLLNIVVLLPINLTSSTSAFRAAGLDRFSISNIAMSKATQLNFHFTCSLVTIISFNVIMYHEFSSIAKIRHTYLNGYSHRRQASSRVLLLGNVPENLRNLEALKDYFSSFYRGLDHVWLMDDYHQYWWKWKQAQDALDILEVQNVRYLKRVARNRGRERENSSLRQNPAFFYPPIYFPVYDLAIIRRKLAIRIPGRFRALLFQKKQPVEPWCTQILAQSYEAISNRITEIAKDNYHKQNKVFLMFNSQESAYMAHQAVLSSDCGSLNQSLIGVNANDIIWANLARDTDFVAVIERYVVYCLMTVMIMMYVIPVSMITLLSQVPLLTQLVPCMGFLGRLPEEMKLTFSSLLPAILLSAVISIQLKIFRLLLYLKGTWTGAEMEIALQKWYFGFLFIQQFLVVSVSTSLIVVCVQVVERPASIPLLLAANIPKSSVFFFKYLSVKAFALTGSNFLQIDRLLMNVFVYSWKDSTPRRKFKRLTSLRKIRWGAAYAAVSVYGAIGVTYCIISPLISVFMVLILGLFLLYYKYALHYVYSHVNDSETNGRLYPKAIFQLYSGIYCLECCMIGIFLSSRDKNGDCPMKFQALVMLLALACTIFANMSAYSRFHQHFQFFPHVNSTKEAENDTPVNVSGDMAGSTADVSQETLLYFHPCYRYQKPVVWLPHDGAGESDEILRRMGQSSALNGGSNEGAMVIRDGFVSRVKITQEPPKRPVN